MSNSQMHLVSEDTQVIEKVKSYLQSLGVGCTVYSHAEWNQKQSAQHVQVVPALTTGLNPVEGGKVLQFPVPTAQSDGKLSTMNEVEKKAIESAILQFQGNLTEAAKALGIGRATVYRKIKDYNIDPSMARKTKKAA